MKTSCSLKFVETNSNAVPLGEDRPWQIVAVGWNTLQLEHLLRWLEQHETMSRRVAVRHLSTPEATFKLLDTGCEIAVILINADAGLPNRGIDMARDIRSNGYVEPRIVIHSQASNEVTAETTLEDYDQIVFPTNPMFVQRVVSKLLSSSLRAYHQIQRLNRSNRMLRRLAHLTSQMISQKGPTEASRIATEAAISLLEGDCGCLCFTDSKGEISFQYGAGCFGSCSRQRTNEERSLIGEALKRKTHQFTSSASVIFVGLHDEPNAAAIFIKGSAGHDEVTHRLVDILAAQVASALNRLRFSQRIEYLAWHDEATALVNHHAIEREIDRSIARGDRHFTVTMVHVETYAEIEASLGEVTANEMIKIIALRLSKPGVKLGRAASNQLVLIGEPLGNNGDQVPRNLLESVCIRTMYLPVSMAIGMCDVLTVSNGQEAIQHARSALRESSISQNQVMRSYDVGIQSAISRRLQLISDLKAAIDNPAEFEVYYQPQVDVRSGRVFGAEALLRWKAGGGCVSPAEFIPVAEATGLIRQIGLYSIIEGIKQAGHWLRSGNPIVVAINLSAAQLGDRSVLDVIIRTMSDAGVPAELLEFELTETAATTQDDATAMLFKLRQYGFRIAIDDFGTGYSSLQRLADQPFDRIKIDKEFVSRAAHSKPHWVVCKTAVSLAKSLNIAVLAEGVETAEQEKLLLDMGCSEAQGYLYGPAVPADRFSFKPLLSASKQRSFLENWSVRINLATTPNCVG